MIFEDASRKFKFGRFILPDEKLICTKKTKGLKKGRTYNVKQYVPDLVLVKNDKGVNKWYSTKKFKRV